ncbi:MAG: PDZ domain-containing protein [Bacteroidota bacterium]
MHYSISYTNPLTHIIDIVFEIEHIDEEEVQLQLPAWRPGRYELANYAQNVLSINAYNRSGDAIALTKVSKDRWKAETKGLDYIRVLYSYFAFKMDAGNSWLDENQLYINFINCMLYVPDRMEEGCTLEIRVPEQYDIVCGLEKTGRSTFQAQNFYQLVDCPLIASDSLNQLQYQIGDVDFNIWIQGLWDLDDKRVIEDFKRFSESQIDMFGEFPERVYHFLLQILPYRHYHGVEHANSTVITLGPGSALNDQDKYDDLLGVSSHELFHTWNVAKIRPEELFPYKFDQEVYFRTGYAIEGFTTYYGDLFLIRSGVRDLNWYFDELNRLFKRHFLNFGRHNLSVTDSSFDLWLDGYKPGIPNRKTSIYVKGAVIALILDLSLRRDSNGESSLDDVMIALWNEFGKKSIGYSENDIIEIVERIAQKPYRNFFEDFVYDNAPLESELDSLLNLVGCELVIEDADSMTERLWGFSMAIQGDSYKVIKIEPGSIAEELLSIDDQIIEINNVKVDDDHNYRVLENRSNQIVIRRFEQNRTVSITNDNRRYFMQHKIKRSENASDAQKLAFKAWLGVDFDG